MVQNNNYDFAVDDAGTPYLLNQYVNQVPSTQGVKTTYSAPQLLKINRQTGVATIVGSLPWANNRHALTSANYHLGFDAARGAVLATYRNYSDAVPHHTPEIIGVASLDVGTGAASEVARIALECPWCTPARGTEVISENGAFGGGLFCDETSSLSNGTTFQDYTCWDLATHGAKVASARNAAQLFDVQWDPRTSRVVGLGICCDGVEGCPAECKGFAGNRTWVTWDPRGGGAPSITARVDPVPAPEFGATYGPMGSALDADARAFTYLAITNASGAEITGLRFVHIDADSGKPRGATPWNFAQSGLVWRYAYVRGS
jgi:hypothetical protein